MGYLTNYNQIYASGGNVDPAMQQQDPAAMQQQSAPEPGGEDINAQVQEAVMAWAESRDPAIPEQVMMMLAQEYGVSPAGAEQQQQGGAPPMGQNGMRMPMYKKGGKFLPRSSQSKEKEDFRGNGVTNPGSGKKMSAQEKLIEANKKRKAKK